MTSKGKHWKLDHRRKGNPRSEKTKEKIREKSLKQFENGMPKETKKKLKEKNKGKHYSLNTEFKKGTYQGHGFKKGQTPRNKGKKGLQTHSEKTREKIRNAHRGEKSYRYIDGRSKKFGPRRYGDDWNQIRNLIYVRDNFICQKCGITQEKYGKTLDIHHKVPFLNSFDNSMQNLITLCRSCHIKEESRMNLEG